MSRFDTPGARLLLALVVVLLSAALVYVLFTTVFPWAETYFTDPSLTR